MMAQILLAIVGPYILAIVWRGRTFRVRLGASGIERAARLRGWAMGVAVSFAVPAVIGLALIGENPLETTQSEAIAIVPGDWPLLPTTPLTIGLVLGTIANAAITHWRWRRGKRAFAIGNFPDVVPQTRGDLIPATVLAISAGVSEELFFRLLMPLLIALVFGSALAATIVASVLFGAVHRYQGWRGVVATTLVGAGLSLLYGLTSALWVAIAFHIAIDLNALVVRPLARGAWRRGRKSSSSSASRS